MDGKSWNPVPGRAQSHQSLSHKSQPTNHKAQTTGQGYGPKEEETWIRVMGLCWKMVSGWPGSCFWEPAAEAVHVHR